jgi:tyrosine-protein kinase Etk/Wzc
MQNENPLNYAHIHEEKPINYRELIEKYTYYWKWFLIGILLALAAAFVYLRYTPQQYIAATSILIEDENSGGLASEFSAFEDLGLLGSGKKKVETEIGLLKSRTLMQNTVQTLGLNISYFTKEHVREMEIYKSKVPFSINFVSKDSLLRSVDTLFSIQALSATHFELKNSNGTKRRNHVFGDVIQTDFGMMSVMLTGAEVFNKGDEVIVKIKPVKAVAKQLNNSLKVELKYMNAGIIELSLNTIIKQKGEDLLNELVRQYNEDAVEDKSLIGKNTDAFINARMRAIKDDLFNADSSVEQFKTSNKLTDITSEASLALKTNSELEKVILDLNTQIKLANYVIDYVNKNANELIPANLGLSDGTVNSNVQRYNKLLLERNRMLKGSKSEHPLIVNLDDQLRQLRRSISGELVNLKSSLRISLSDALNEEQKMSSKITSVPRQEREYRDIQRQQQIIETLYLYLLQKREENAIALAITVPNAKVIDRADSGNIPVSPKKSVVYLVAIMLGGLIPFMTLYILFLFDNKVHTSKDVESIVNAPVIGEIPHSKSENKMVVSENDKDNIAESFRMLRTNINFMLSGVQNGAQTIFVTSTLSAEGKTFISLNLATVLALSSKKVLLIGADVRKPKLDEYMGLTIDKGLTHYLADDTMNIADIITSYPKGNLDVIGSGVVPPNPSELLMNGRFEDVITYGKAEYDFIIIDTAPIKMVTDTLLLSHYADLSLYIVRADVLDKRLLEIPKKMYSEKRLTNMVVVLNDVNTKKGGYDYGYGYGYGQEPPKKL